jgi:hypothetical protein
MWSFDRLLRQLSEFLLPLSLVTVPSLHLWDRLGSREISYRLGKLALNRNNKGARWTHGLTSVLRQRVTKPKMGNNKLPWRVNRFRAGDVVRRSDGSLCAIVIRDAEQGRHGSLMSLPAGQTFEATIDEMTEWEIAHLPGPRLVHVRRTGSNEIAWSTYLPDFESACALWRELEGRTPRMFEVDICPQHVDEKMALDDAGYYKRQA